MPRQTLIAALTVNKTFSSAALPLLYEHLYFDPKRVHKRGKIKDDYLHHVKILDIFNHDIQDCIKLEFEHSPEVIRFDYNDTIETIHKWHDGMPCPLLNLKPQSVVFLGFDATKAPPDPKAFKVPIYHETKNRVVVWDITEEFNQKGYNAAVKNVFFPPEKDDINVESRVKAIKKGKGGEPKPDDLTRSEVVIFANSSNARRDGLHFHWWFHSWAKEHSRRKHIVVNLKAMWPTSNFFIDSIEEELWKWCANKSEEWDLPYEEQYDNVNLLRYVDWERIEDCRPMLEEYLTEQEIRRLLPPPKIPKAPKAESSGKGKKKK